MHVSVRSWQLSTGSLQLSITVDNFFAAGQSDQYCLSVYCFGKWSEIL